MLITRPSLRVCYVQLVSFSKISYTCAGHHGLGTFRVTVSESPKNPDAGLYVTEHDLRSDDPAATIQHLRGLPDAEPIWFAAENISEFSAANQVRSGSASANEDALALISGVVGSTKDTEPRAPALMATVISTKNSAPVGTRDQYLGETSQI
jgi:hypothetical protein